MITVKCKLCRNTFLSTKVDDDIPEHFCKAVFLPEKIFFSNQLNFNKMNNLTKEQLEKLEKTKDLAFKISELKETIELIKESNKFSEENKGRIWFRADGMNFPVSLRFINFKSLHNQILSSMNKELKALEKEFEAV